MNINSTIANSLKMIIRPNTAKMRGEPGKAFDWDKAAKLIREQAEEIETASAGLKEDWGNTSGIIFQQGKIEDQDYLYLGSLWATPVLEITFRNGVVQVVECFALDTPNLNPVKWDAETKWPESARKILEAK